MISVVRLAVAARTVTAWGAPQGSDADANLRNDRVLDGTDKSYIYGDVGIRGDVIARK